MKAHHGSKAPRVRHVALARKIEAEIVPKLVLDRRMRANGAVSGVALPEDAATLARVLIAGDLAGARAHLETLIDRGLSPERIRLDLLAPVARRIGDAWDRDDCDFAEIARGLGMLRQILLTLRPSFTERPAVDPRRRVLLVTLAGEQHTFGLRMVSDCFTLAGWGVRTVPSISDEQLGTVVGGDWFTIVGFAVGTDAQRDRLAKAIRIVRRRARNSAVGIIAGGPGLANDPDLALRLGADGTAPDADHAIRLAERLRVILEDAAA